MRKLLIVIALLAARPAFGCSCVPTSSVEQQLSRAAAVFAGVVEEIDDPWQERLATLSEEEARLEHLKPPILREGDRRVTFRVMQWWKNETVPENIEVWTGRGGGDCGYPVEIGKSYLVFANRGLDGRLFMSICGRTAALVCAMEDVEELGYPIRTFEKPDLESLIEREQPYTTRWRPCMKPARLIGERGLKFDKHCRFMVKGRISLEGKIEDFVIERVLGPVWCDAEKTREMVKGRVAEWEFHPAEIDGTPVEQELTTISIREPITESEYAAHLEQQREWKEKQAKEKQREE